MITTINMKGIYLQQILDITSIVFEFWKFCTS